MILAHFEIIHVFISYSCGEICQDYFFAVIFPLPSLIQQKELTIMLLLLCEMLCVEQYPISIVRVYRF